MNAERMWNRADASKGWLTLCARVALAAAALALAAGARGSSQTIRIDGNVYTAAGAPVTGTRDILVKAYTASTGGSALWASSTFANTTVANGRFSVSLDASNGLTQAWSDASGSLWFEITVGGDIVKPRIQAKGAMFAIAAATADRIRNQNVSNLTPVTGDVLAWNGSAWTPTSGSGLAAGSYVAKAGDTMTGGLQLAAGSGTTPTLNFGDTGTGLYRPAAAAVAVSINGVQRLLVGSSSTQIVQPVGASSTGDQSSPSYSFIGSWNTGLFPVSGGLGLTSGGAERMRVTTAGAVVFPGMAADKALYLNASTQLATSAVSGTELGYLSGVTAALQTQINAVSTVSASHVAKAGDTMTGPLVLPGGSLAAPTLTFGTTNTGLYRSGGDGVGIVVDGTQILYVNSGFLALTVPVALSVSQNATASKFITSTTAATASFPAVSVGQGTNAGGLYAPASGDLGLAAGGSLRLNFTSAGAIVIPGLTPGNALYVSASTQLTSSAVTGTELGYLSGVTSNVQTQINNITLNGSTGYVAKAGDTMTGSLRVNGQTWSPPGTGLDFSTGNVQYVSNDCSTTVALTNMQDGGSYTLVNTDTGTNVCTFSSGSDTFKYKGNSARTGTTVYSFIKANSIIYTSVLTGF